MEARQTQRRRRNRGSVEQLEDEDVVADEDGVLHGAGRDEGDLEGKRQERETREYTEGADELAQGKSQNRNSAFSLERRRGPNNRRNALIPSQLRFFERRANFRYRRAVE